MRRAFGRLDIAVFGKLHQHRADGRIAVAQRNSQLMLGHRAALLQDNQEEGTLVRDAHLGLQQVIGGAVKCEHESAQEVGRRGVHHNVTS